VPESKDLITHARNYLINGNIDNAIEFAQESIQWIQHATNGLHKEILHSYDMLVSALTHGQDYISAISVCGRSLNTSIQLTGLDSSETLQNHLHVAYLFSEIGQYLVAMKHIQAARYIALLLGGESHPEIIGILIKIAGIYKSTGNFAEASLCLNICHERLQVCGDQVKCYSFRLSLLFSVILNLTCVTS
jgi:tetratricopeptide (TPR) repeat protein